MSGAEKRSSNPKSCGTLMYGPSYSRYWDSGLEFTSSSFYLDRHYPHPSLSPRSLDDLNVRLSAESRARERFQHIQHDADCVPNHCKPISVDDALLHKSALTFSALKSSLVHEGHLQLVGGKASSSVGRTLSSSTLYNNNNAVNKHGLCEEPVSGQDLLNKTFHRGAADGDRARVDKRLHCQAVDAGGSGGGFAKAGGSAGGGGGGGRQDPTVPAAPARTHGNVAAPGDRRMNANGLERAMTGSSTTSSDTNYPPSWLTDAGAQQTAAVAAAAAAAAAAAGGQPRAPTGHVLLPPPPPHDPHLGLPATNPASAIFRPPHTVPELPPPPPPSAPFPFSGHGAPYPPIYTSTVTSPYSPGGAPYVTGGSHYSLYAPYPPRGFVPPAAVSPGSAGPFMLDSSHSSHYSSVLRHMNISHQQQQHLPHSAFPPPSPSSQQYGQGGSTPTNSPGPHPRNITPTTVHGMGPSPHLDPNPKSPKTEPKDGGAGPGGARGATSSARPPPESGALSLRDKPRRPSPPGTYKHLKGSSSSAGAAPSERRDSSSYGYPHKAPEGVPHAAGGHHGGYDPKHKGPPPPGPDDLSAAKKPRGEPPPLQPAQSTSLPQQHPRGATASAAAGGVSSHLPPLPPLQPASYPAQPHYPPHFMKGSIIQLANGELKRVEDLRTDDFVNSADISPDLKIDSSTVVRIQQHADRGTAILGFSVGEQRIQVTVEATLEHPFFVFGRGWSSCSPQRTLHRYGLPCQELRVGDVCISLTHKDPGVPVSAPSSSSPSSSAACVSPSTESGSRRGSCMISEHAAPAAATCASGVVTVRGAARSGSLHGRPGAPPHMPAAAGAGRVRYPLAAPSSVAQLPLGQHLVDTGGAGGGVGTSHPPGTPYSQSSIFPPPFGPHGPDGGDGGGGGPSAAGSGRVPAGRKRRWSAPDPPGLPPATTDSGPLGADTDESGGGPSDPHRPPSRRPSSTGSNEDDTIDVDDSQPQAQQQQQHEHTKRT